MVTKRKLIFFLTLSLFSSIAFANDYIMDDTIKTLLDSAINSGQNRSEKVSYGNMLSCKGLKARIEKTSLYNDIFDNLKKEKNLFSKRMKIKEMANYISENFNDTYIDRFSKNKINIQIQEKFDLEKIYLVLIGGEVKVFFPKGAKSLVVQESEMSFSLSNFNICLNEYFIILEIDNCNAQNLFDFSLCSNIQVSLFKLKAPRKELRSNSRMVIGGGL